MLHSRLASEHVCVLQIMHNGQIAEMRTGEGKTLVAILPAVLNALTGEGVQVRIEQLHPDVERSLASVTRAASRNRRQFIVPVLEDFGRTSCSHWLCQWSWRLLVCGKHMALSPDGKHGWLFSFASGQECAQHCSNLLSW